ncbi:adenine glycosylase [Candidatus Methylomirabilis lanthanidiphila]|uniref:Adenine DNA glycosylase n=1 Tax=Candidatus Methylomirabilis lanthanidiphila TaxID=2211376 RepID=A0A564ZET3_9BACT|nr:adenine glycosylase [Candidatus Methylomirabilis lanthanidiphila]
MSSVNHHFPDPVIRRKFRQRLLRWYARHQRDLPWRKTSDPYKILVSEVMLQQTQVDRVIPKYKEFLRKYPTLQELAGASVGDVEATWRPLGYNIRPVRLHAIAQEAVGRHRGKIPDSLEELQAFKGIGRYTAGAVMSFAFRKDAPILDTNVKRVLQRVFLGSTNGNGSKPLKRLWDLSAALIPKGKAYDFNQALMDFGALICTARKPNCPNCPMQPFCLSYPWDKDNTPCPKLQRPSK